MTQPPEETQKKKSNLYRFKNTAASSGLGNSIFQKYADEETTKILNALKILVSNQYDKEQGSTVKKNIVKIVIKVLLLYEDKQLEAENFQEIYALFRKICALIKNTYYRELTKLTKGPLDKQSAMRISEFGEEMEGNLITLLSKFVSPKTQQRIHVIFGYLKNVDFVTQSFSDPIFSQIVIVLAYYLDKYPPTL
eukprot:TRINITY_DN11277_c0_g1_i1.p1 TRINITY_DN11277_c0_g1~~TRINITY_DN11277_c0_g1_i1.p1  ORF type:complete len:194 (+),score=38.08 TRINITY_DN11277_c0_g1_i1:188-769(+)